MEREIILYSRNFNEEKEIDNNEAINKAASVLIPSLLQYEEFKSLPAERLEHFENLCLLCIKLSASLKCNVDVGVYLDEMLGYVCLTKNDAFCFELNELCRLTNLATAASRIIFGADDGDDSSCILVDYFFKNNNASVIDSFRNAVSK